MIEACGLVVADAPTREKIAREMRAFPETTRVVFARFRKPELRPLIGKTLAEVAKARGKDEVDAILDLVLACSRTARASPRCSS